MDDPRLPAIRALVEPMLAERQVELVELTCRPQGGHLLIRLLVDRVGGVTIQQCAQLNQLIGWQMEERDLIEGRYTIEVSSPGLDRPLASRRDFERALGEEVHVTLNTGNGRFQEMQGVLLAVQPEAIVLKTDEGTVTVACSQIQFAKKALRW